MYVLDTFIGRHVLLLVTYGHPATKVRFPELLELGMCMCATDLCEIDFDRVLVGSPKMEKIAFISTHMALTRIDLIGPNLR